MRLRRRANINDPDLGITQQIRKILRRLYTGHIQLNRLIASNVPRHTREVAIQMTPARIAQRRNPYFRHLAIRLDMRRRHEPQPNNPDIHFRKLYEPSSQ